MPSIPITTGLSRPPAAIRSSRALRVGAFALSVLVIEAVLAHGLVGPQISKLVLLFVALYLVAAVFRFPLATGLLFLAFTDFIFYPTFFAPQVGPITVRPHEVCLTLLLSLAILRPKARTFGGVGGKALAVFLAVVLFSAAVAYEGGSVSLTEAFNWSRPFYSLCFFWVVIRLFPSSEDRRTLLLGAAVLAAVTGVVALAVAAGASFGQQLQGPGEQIIKEEGGLGSLKRVRLAGLSAGYILFWYVAAQAASRIGRPRLGWLLLLGGIFLDIAVSLNRNMWIGLTVGLLLMVIWGGVTIRARFANALGIGLAIILLVFAFGSATSNDQIAKPLIERGETLFHPGKTAQSSSLQERGTETEEAWKTIQAHPLIGVGAGAPFGVTHKEVAYGSTGTISVRSEEQLFLHDQYLYLLLIGGPLALIAFVVFLGSAVRQAWTRHPRDPAITACAVGIVLVMLSAVVAIYFSSDDMTAMLGMLAGVIFADATGPGRQGLPSGLIRGQSEVAPGGATAGKRS